jgi:tRNA A37 threonylcarbamoyladenosine dehydratase
LLGKERLEKLQNSRITIVGLGAVGSFAAEALARCGVKNFRLVDFDIIKKSNINRQLYAIHSTLGMYKVDAAFNRIKDINPSCNIEKINLFAHYDTIDKILDNNPDLLIDAIDSYNPKVVLLTYAYKMGIKTVSSMGAALKRDPFKIKKADLFDTTDCNLAKLLRYKLRKNNVGRGIVCVYSTEKSNNSLELTENEIIEDKEFKRGRERRILGSLPTITGIFGLMLANIAIDILTG